MGFLGQNPVRCKIFAVNNCLQKVEIFKYLGYKFPVKMKRVFEKTSEVFSNTGNSNKNFKPTLIQKFSRAEVYNALALRNILYGNEIWTLRKNI